MENYILNGENMTTRADAHDEIARVLNFPAYYGRNLDALWDMVSTMEAEVILVNAPAMCNALGDYGCKLMQTLYEAAEENARFRFKLI